MPYAPTPAVASVQTVYAVWVREWGNIGQPCTSVRLHLRQTPVVTSRGVRELGKSSWGDAGGCELH